MLWAGFLRARSELQIHRGWLQRFVAGRSARRTLTSSISRRATRGHQVVLEAKETSSRSPSRRTSGSRRVDVNGASKERRRLGSGGIHAPGTSLKDSSRVTSKRDNDFKYPGSRKVALGGDAFRQGVRKSHQAAAISELVDRQELHTAIRDLDVKGIVKAYVSLTKDHGSVAAAELHPMMQCVHECLRRERRRSDEQLQRENLDGQVRRDNISEIVAFAQLVIDDIKRYALPPNRGAHMHLLALLRDAGSRDVALHFWEWLQTQDDNYLHHDTYGAAIQLLAVNGAPLDEMEALYTEALTRFPGSFLSYHLSPNAFLQDREQPTTLKGIPSTLLQGIAVARLSRGDSRNAYLALDTIFRLYPVAVPPHFFAVFLEERPLSEAFTVFAMACRGGHGIGSGLFRTFLAKIRTASDLTSMPVHLCTLRVMLVALYLQLGAGLPVAANTVSELVIAITQILRLPGIESVEQEKQGQAVDAVLSIVRKTLEIFGRYGISPRISAFNSIITNVAGLARGGDVLETALKDMATLGLIPNDVTMRSILSVAGSARDARAVEESWAALVEARRADAKWPDSLDFHVLTQAGQRADNMAYVREQFDALKGHLESHHQERLQLRLDSPDDELKTDKDPAGELDFEDMMRRIAKLNEDLAVLDECTKEALPVQDFSTQRLPAMLLPPDEIIVMPEEATRTLYDEMTTEQPAPQSSSMVIESSLAEAPAPEADPNSQSTTGFTFGQLRYENWKSINALLALAEKHDAAFEKAVDEAIESGVRAPKREMGLTKGEWAAMDGFGLSGNQEEPGAIEEAVGVNAARAEVKRLRGV